MSALATAAAWRGGPAAAGPAYAGCSGAAVFNATLAVANAIDDYNNCMQ